MSAKDTDRGCVIHAKSDNVEITIDDEQIKLLKNFLNYIFKDVKYALSKQWEAVRFSLIMPIYYSTSVKKKILIRGGTSKQFPNWIKNKKVTINPIIQVMTNALNKLQQSQQIMKKLDQNPERVSEIKRFTGKFNREGITFQSGKND